jgi:hypothetical protein
MKFFRTFEKWICDKRSGLFAIQSRQLLRGEPLKFEAVSICFLFIAAFSDPELFWSETGGV